MPAELPVILDAQATRQALARLDVLAAMRTLFTALGHGRAVQPPQTLTLFPDGRGDFIVYAGVLPDASVFGVKVSPYLATPSGGRVTAWTLLMSMATGQPLLLCDALSLTAARTAATSALAVDLLARRDVKTLAVLGSGLQAMMHLQYVLPLRAWQQVTIHSPRIAEKARDLRPALDALHPDIRVAASGADATADADVVLLCTSSATPVLEPQALDRPAVIVSISTNAPQAHEIPPSALPALDVYCDYRATTPAVAGEMQLAQAHGWSPADVRGDLGELLTGRSLGPSYTRPIFFRSVGLGLEDVQLAYAVYEHHHRDLHE